MEENKEAVKTDSTAAEGQEVKKEEHTASNVQEFDYESEIKSLNDRLAKTAEERDNYKKGLLIAKGKIEDDSDEDDLDSKIHRIVQENLISAHEKELRQQRDELIDKMARENRELKLALKNKNIPTTSTGGSEDKPEASTSFFTSQQIEDLKKKGLDPDKVKENLLKLKGRVI